LIQKWLKAGVMEDGQWSETKEGSPQGSAISPILANLYLHYVLDVWVEQWRKKQAHGDVIIVRYADDAVLGFERREEAERFLEQLRERLRKFGLELHPEKTRLIEFGRYAAERRKKRGEGKPETYNFLGFTHICGTNYKTGNFTIPTEDDRQTHGSQAQRDSSQATPADARWRFRYAEVAAVDSAGVLRISRYSGQLGTNEGVPQRCAANLVSNAPAAKPA
jgi:RNA-directed DNA polymerase